MAAVVSPAPPRAATTARQVRAALAGVPDADPEEREQCDID